ncbi:ATP-NAD kinase family protein [Streptomyces iconiensis]|uniref:NAD(+)/NADH kinase n=1 Tax=Streptomyces iconiensis TaxID=1384038 RepID=A0ABT6ZZ10_9ACTN|nr:NAD(+)/NADH kinase [Streptomyces iconiensis]MDJ1134299.1 NAD(+)/NADH kinase [Streptomyces iconiensis]
MSAVRIGLVVNPVAGLGGRVGLKGSDGAAVQTRALALGAVPCAGERAAVALAELRARGGEFELYTAAGPMGATLAGTACHTVHRPPAVTSPDDTVAAVRALVAAGVGLLLFAGGDGTARDVLRAVGDGSTLPVLGVPTGVKMHSAVFAVNPRAAGEVAAAYLRGGVDVRRCEVMDRDPEALRAGRLASRLYGWLSVPHVPVRVQSRKAGSAAVSPESAGGIAAELRARMSPGSLLVLGPGTTTRAVAAALGVDVSPDGVNVLETGRGSAALLAQDANADGLLALTHAREAHLALTPIGGQGFLLGRGNQQLTPDLLRRVGPARMAIVCTEAKLAALGGRPLLVDTGDEELDAALTGHHRVITGRRTTTMYRLVS